MFLKGIADFDKASIILDFGDGSITPFSPKMKVITVRSWRKFERIVEKTKKKIEKGKCKTIIIDSLSDVEELLTKSVVK